MLPYCCPAAAWSKKDGGDHDKPPMHSLELNAHPCSGIANKASLYFEFPDISLFGVVGDTKQISPGISCPQVEEWDHVYTVPLRLGFTVEEKNSEKKKSCL